MNDILTAVVAFLVGGGGVAGLMVYYLRRYIDKRLEDEETKAAERVEIRKKRMAVDDKLQHAYGRMFFWLHRGVVKPPPGEELEEAFQALNAVEAEKKELDREIIAIYDKEI